MFRVAPVTSTSKSTVVLSLVAVPPSISTVYWSPALSRSWSIVTSATVVPPGRTVMSFTTELAITPFNGSPKTSMVAVVSAISTPSVSTPKGPFTVIRVAVPVSPAESMSSLSTTLSTLMSIAGTDSVGPTALMVRTSAASAALICSDAVGTLKSTDSPKVESIR